MLSSILSKDIPIRFHSFGLISILSIIFPLQENLTSPVFFIFRLASSSVSFPNDNMLISFVLEERLFTLIHIIISFLFANELFHSSLLNKELPAVFSILLAFIPSKEYESVEVSFVNLNIFLFKSTSFTVSMVLRIGSSPYLSVGSSNIISSLKLFSNLEKYPPL